MKKAVGYFLLGLGLAIPGLTHARSCEAPVLERFPLIFHAEIIDSLVQNKMQVRVRGVLRGRENRVIVTISYAGVAVWSQTDIFKPGSAWVFALDPDEYLRNGQYELVLCATEYLPIEDGQVSVNLDGSGYESYSLEELGSLLQQQ